MTRLRAWWDGHALTDDQATTVTAMCAVFIAVTIAGLLWGQYAINVVFGVTLLATIWDRVRTREWAAEALDLACRAHDRLQEVVDHLTGTEPVSQGRHADGAPQQYRPSPRPRSEAA